MTEESIATPMCPFFKEPCRKDACALWAEAKKLDPRIGTVTTEHQCGLTMQPIIMVASAPPNPMSNSGIFRPR